MLLLQLLQSSSVIKRLSLQTMLFAPNWLHLGRTAVQLGSALPVLAHLTVTLDFESVNCDPSTSQGSDPKSDPAKGLPVQSLLLNVKSVIGLHPYDWYQCCTPAQPIAFSFIIHNPVRNDELMTHSKLISKLCTTKR
jgi:hypothetical protein